MSWLWWEATAAAFSLCGTRPLACRCLSLHRLRGLSAGDWLLLAPVATAPPYPSCASSATPLSRLPLLSSTTATPPPSNADLLQRRRYLTALFRSDRFFKAPRIMERLVVEAGAALVAASDPRTQDVRRLVAQPARERVALPAPQHVPMHVPLPVPPPVQQPTPQCVQQAVPQPVPLPVREEHPRAASPFGATAGGDPGSRPADHVPATALERILLQHCLDESEEDPAAAAARTEVVLAGCARSAGREPMYHFSPPPSLVKMRTNVDTFESDFMECIVRTWPQAPVTALSRKARAAGIICSGAQDGAGKRTNVEQKTWSLRISVAMRFANFIGRTVCLPIDGQRPPDEEIDRGVAKFFNCLNLQTQEVINAFLDARREGLAVAGGGKKIMERTVKGYSAALGFLFYDARLVGVTGEKLVPDCVGQRSPWQKKGQLEKETEKRDKREDPGDYIGNPMDAEAIKTHKGAAEKEARKAGQHNTTSADVTPQMLSLLYDALVRRHFTTPTPTTPPTTGAAGALGQETAPATPVIPARSASVVPSLTPAHPDAVTAGNDANIANLSERQTDFLAYAFYAFLFKTLARPLTLINLKYKDITLPDTLVPANEQFFNKCVFLGHRPLSCVGVGSLKCAGGGCELRLSANPHVLRLCPHFFVVSLEPYPWSPDTGILGFSTSLCASPRPAPP